MKQVSLLFICALFLCSWQYGFAQPEYEDFIANGQEDNDITQQRTKTPTHAKDFKLLPEINYRVGEKLEFKVKYGFIQAGVASLLVKETDAVIDDKELVHIVAQGRTTGITNFFYPVHNVYHTYIDADTRLPYAFAEKVKEEDYTRDDFVKFNQETGKAVGVQTSVVVDPPLFDIISLFYYARNIDLTQYGEGDTFKLKYFLGDEVSEVAITYVAKERVKTSLGYIDCIKFKPSLRVGRVFRSADGLFLWVSNDKNHIPIKAKGDILIGSVVLEIVSFENLKYPIDVRKKR